ncbi:MAG TPA: permease prefix domain 1-containing protein [Meiothermus sp.]|nr:permease prefix domain 1-containing protein [Meiothermus sp.]
MSELNRYLRGATRGLWGRKRAEVWAELEGNLRLRIQELQVAGLPEEEAERKALEEIGEPQIVQEGMMRLYAFPKVARASLLAVLALAGLLVILPGQAQVSLEVFKIHMAYSQGNHLKPASVWVEAKDLTPLQTRSGPYRPDTLTLVADGKTLEVPVNTVEGGPWDGRRFVDLVRLVLLAEHAGVGVRLEGWEKPSLQLGATRLDLQSLGAPATPEDRLGYSLYVSLLANSLMAQRGLRPHEFSPNPPGCLHQIITGDQPGTIYAAVSRAPAKGARSPDDQLTVGPVDGSGSVRLRLMAPTVQFTRDTSAIAEGRGGLVRVALVKITGEVKDGGLAYQVVMPAKTRSQAVPGSCR